jgi:transposase
VRGDLEGVDLAELAGERSPAALAALGDARLKATPEQLAGALTGRFREIHAFEIATHLRLIDTINDEITRLDTRIEQQLASIPGVAPACTSCGLIGGGHSPGCPSDGTPVLGLVERLDEITGVGVCNAQVTIAELGTDMSVFPTPGHAAAWARLTSRTLQSGTTVRPGRAGKGNPYLRGALGQCVMAASRTDTRLGEQYRRIARRRGKQKAIVAVSRVICEISAILIADPAARFTDLGAGYYSALNPRRQTRSKIRELERLNPGMKVTLTPIGPAATAA